MSFLAPLFLLGAAAIALPIIFHLARRSTPDRIPFSSLMFLSPTPPRASRRSRLEHILLLILRCLAITLLAIGFGRPFIQRALSNQPAATSGKRAVLMVDTSASMRREGVWASAQAKVDEVLGRLTPGDQLALFTFDSQTRALASFEQLASSTERAAIARQRLADVKPGWSATHLGSALIAAAEALDLANKTNAVGQPAAGEIVVVSDLQEGSRLDGLQGYDWPRGVNVVLERAAGKPRSNSGLQWAADAGASLTPRVRVSNATDARQSQFQIRWADPATGRALPGTPLDIYVPPGQNRVAQAPKPEPGWTNATLVLAGDEEPFDNTVYWLPPQVEDTYVCYLGNERENDPAESLYYLKRAWRETPRQKINVQAVPLTEPLPEDILAKSQLIVFTDSLSGDQQRRVKQLLEAGKSVMFALSSNTTAATLGGLLGAPVAVTEAKVDAGYAMLSQIDFAHPLFAPFADPRYSDFTRIHIWKHRQADLDKVAGAQVLARFDDGAVALAQIPVGKGRLLVWTTTWRPADSQLAVSSKFVPLLYSVLDQSRPAPVFTTQYTVEDTIDLAWLSETGPIHVTPPEGAAVALPDGTRKFNQTLQPGIYAANATGKNCRFAVNLAPEESRTAPLPAEELERLRVPVAEKAWDTSRQVKTSPVVAAAAALENEQKLWRWLIVAASAILIMETGLAGWLAHRAMATHGGKI